MESERKAPICSYSVKLDLSEISYHWIEGWYSTDDGKAHREDGPAFIGKNGDVEWWFNNLERSFEEWCKVTQKTEEEIIQLKLKYG